jgi:hypothetical protein
MVEHSRNNGRTRQTSRKTQNMIFHLPTGAVIWGIYGEYTKITIFSFWESFGNPKPCRWLYIIYHISYTLR